MKMGLKEWVRNLYQQHYTYEEQVKFLEKCGIVILDRPKALHQLKHVGLGTLMPYLCYFWYYDENGKYFNRVSWDSIYQLYQFNDNLRVLLLQATGKVETSLLELLAYHLEQHYGAYWHLRDDLFKHSSSENVCEGIQDFMQMHRKYKYYTFREIKEGMSLGLIYRIYSHFENHQIKETIAREMGMPPVIAFSSSIYALMKLRNSCAHPQRIWNKKSCVVPDEFYYAPHPYIWLNNSLNVDRRRIYYLFCLLNYFMQVIDPDFIFAAKLCQLLEQNKEVISFYEMGFPDNWREDPMWRV